MMSRPGRIDHPLVSQRSRFRFHLRSLAPFVSADPSSLLSQPAHAACGVPPGPRPVTAPGWPPGGHGVTLLMHPERERHRMITGPGDEMEAAAGGPGDMRASHADRERVIDTVKAAFARGQLTAGELDARVGQALTARTYAELAAVTLSIPARSDLARPAKPVLAQPRRRPGNRLVNRGVCVITATTLAAGVWVGIVAGAAAAVIVAMFMLNLAALATRP